MFPGFPIKVSGEVFRSIFNNMRAYSTYIFRDVLRGWHDKHCCGGRSARFAGKPLLLTASNWNGRRPLTKEHSLCSRLVWLLPGESPDPRARTATACWQSGAWSASSDSPVLEMLHQLCWLMKQRWKLNTTQMTLGCLGHSCLEKNCSMMHGQAPGGEESIFQASSEDLSAWRNPFMPIYTWKWRHMGQEKETASCTLHSGTGDPWKKRKTERWGRRIPTSRRKPSLKNTLHTNGSHSKGNGIWRAPLGKLCAPEPSLWASHYCF